MTAPAPSPAEQAVIDRFGIFDEEQRVRYQLIEALECSDIDLRIGQIANALLPVVELIANQRAAAELRVAAKVVNTGVFPDEQAPGMRRAVVGLLVARADALDPS